MYIYFYYIKSDYSFTLKREIIYDFVSITYNTQHSTINTLLKKCSLINDNPDITRIEKILLVFKGGKEQVGLIKAKKYSKLSGGDEI